MKINNIIYHEINSFDNAYGDKFYLPLFIAANVKSKFLNDLISNETLEVLILKDDLNKENENK